MSRARVRPPFLASESSRVGVREGMLSETKETGKSSKGEGDGWKVRSKETGKEEGRVKENRGMRRT